MDGWRGEGRQDEAERGGAPLKHRSLFAYCRKVLLSISTDAKEQEGMS